MLLDAHVCVEGLDESQAMVGVEDEGDLGDEEVGQDGGLEPAQVRGGLAHELVVLAALHLLVEEGVVGRERAELARPELAAALEISRVEPEFRASAPDRLPARLRLEALRESPIGRLKASQDPVVHLVLERLRDPGSLRRRDHVRLLPVLHASMPQMAWPRLPQRRGPHAP